jgi:hypothetical protein
LTITSETKFVVEDEVEVTKTYEKSLVFTNTFPESDSEKETIIPYGTGIPETFNVDWNIFLPVVPNTFCTYSDTTTPNKTGASVFNFF